MLKVSGIEVETDPQEVIEEKQLLVRYHRGIGTPREIAEWIVAARGHNVDERVGRGAVAAGTPRCRHAAVPRRVTYFKSISATAQDVE